MDPITSAIVAALPALASDMVSSVVKDAYAGLKSLIAKKFGATSAVAKSVEDLEAHPKSQGRAKVLSEEVDKTDASSDTEILAAVNKLVEALSKAGQAVGGAKIDVKISGGQVGVAGARNVTVGSMNVGGRDTSGKD